MLVNELQALFIEVFYAERQTVVLLAHLAEDAVNLAGRAVTMLARHAQVAGDVMFDVARRDRVAAEYERLATAVAGERV